MKYTSRAVYLRGSELESSEACKAQEFLQELHPESSDASTAIADDTDGSQETVQEAVQVGERCVCIDRLILYDDAATVLMHMVCMTRLHAGGGGGEAGGRVLPLYELPST
jgi:hypothetical protein